MSLVRTQILVWTHHRFYLFCCCWRPSHTQFKGGVGGETTYKCGGGGGDGWYGGGGGGAYSGGGGGSSFYGSSCFGITQMARGNYQTPPQAGMLDPDYPGNATWNSVSYGVKNPSKTGNNMVT